MNTAPCRLLSLTFSAVLVNCCYFCHPSFIDHWVREWFKCYLNNDVWRLFISDSVSVCGRHILQCVLHIFSLWQSGDLVVLQVCRLNSPLCDSVSPGILLFSELPQGDAPAEGWCCWALESVCLLLLKFIASMMIPAFRRWQLRWVLPPRRDGECRMGETSVLPAHGMRQTLFGHHHSVVKRFWETSALEKKLAIAFLLLLELLSAAGLPEPVPRGVGWSLRRLKGCVHLFSEGHGQRNFLCSH